MRVDRLVGFVGLSIAAELLVACASAPPPAAPAPAGYGQPSVQSEGAPTDAEGALAELDRAEAELQRAFGNNRAAEKGADEASKPVQLGESPPDPCETACKALASMKRASEHLCSLAGDGDERCSAGRDRLAKAGERVRGSCPSCALGP